jgi:hypothetical protein
MTAPTVDLSSTWIGIGKVTREGDIKKSIDVIFIPFDRAFVLQTGPDSIRFIPSQFDGERVSGIHESLELPFEVPVATSDERYVCAWAATKDIADRRVMRRIMAK